MSESTTEIVPVEPAELIATKIPRQREFVLKRPGNINYTGEKGSYPGCRLVQCGGASIMRGGSIWVYGLEEEDLLRFTEQLEKEREEADKARGEFRAIELVNLYFKHRANLLTLEVESGHGDSIYVMFTNQIEDDEADEFLEASRFLEDHMQAFREKKAAKKHEADEAKAKAETELKELAELGRKEKAGGFVKRARAAEEEVERLTKELNRLKKRLGEK
jgi:hypothetical protein